MEDTKLGEGGGSRKLIKELLDKRALDSAITLAKSLVASSSALDDHLLLCHCFFLNGDFRRCVSILERCGVAQNESLSKTSQLITSVLAETVIRPVAKEDFSRLSGALLLVQCQLRCDEHRECSHLLHRLLGLGAEAVDPHTIYFADHRVDSVRQLQSALSQLFCQAGLCFDQLEQKKRALGAFQRALAVDPRCLEACQFLLKTSALSMDEKVALVESTLLRCNSEERDFYDQHYRSLLTQQQMKVSKTASIACERETIEFAESLYLHGLYAEAYTLTYRRLMAQDPLSPSCALLCLSCMVLLRKTNDLFCFAHELMASHPKQALSLYAVGCYYYVVGSAPANAQARDLCLSYLRKACKRDKRFVQAHLLLGHILSTMEESDQAMAAYRAASRLQPDDWIIWTCLGQELIRVNSCGLAVHALMQAKDLCLWSPTIFNELGVACIKLKRQQESLQYFQRAAELIIEEQKELRRQNAIPVDALAAAASPKNLFYSMIFYNFATVLRMTNAFDEAVVWYERSLCLNPNDGATLTAYGLTLHMLRRFEEAIAIYHKSIALQPKLSLAMDLLSCALDDILFYVPATATNHT